MTATRGPCGPTLPNGYTYTCGEKEGSFEFHFESCPNHRDFYALAPELLEALKECYDKVELDRDTMLKAKALIAKAEGGK